MDVPASERASQTKKEIWEEHKEIFHYTTQAGLEGILRSQCLHATHYKYLNDTTEMRHMEDKLVNAIIPAAIRFLKLLAAENAAVRAHIEADGGYEIVAAKEAHAVIGSLYKVTFGVGRPRNFFEPFLLSFCAHNNEHERLNGRLSQWRGYGRDSGYAIGFDVKLLNEMIQNEAHRYFCYPGCIGDVVYDGEDKKFDAEFADLIRNLTEAYPKLVLDERGDLKGLYESFLTSVSRFKHGSFQEEREVRAVFSPMKTSDIEALKREEPDKYELNKHKSAKTILFKSGFVPYVTLAPQTGNLPITRIIVGPHAEKEKRKAALERYLSFCSLQIPVTASATPFV